MKRFFLTLGFFISALALTAQIPSGYYDAANGKTGDELKVALHNIIKGHTTVSYSNLWNAFWSTDNKGNSIVWDMYSDNPNGTPPYTYYLGQGQCGSYDEEGDCYNREHSWPQSWFNSQTIPSSDLHHIFPTDGFVNAQRGNNAFGEVQSASWTSQNGSKLGNCKSSLGYSGTVFEPIDAYKGDFARALMYMSVRYYSEDSNWGSSGMTNKSELKPWAIALLMDWNEQDPVSQKELDRNNAIYSQYQHNRNPFIDHPEYARMIWDPNWQGGTYYNITCATGLQHGSVSAPESAMEGTTVAISATPEPGYMVGTYTVYKTGSPNTTVTVSSNGTFTMPGYAVTVSATFVENNTYYDIALGAVSHGSISASPTSAKSGTNITLTAMPNSGYSLYAWYVFKTSDMNTIVNVSGNSFVMPAFDVTVMATFVQGSVNGDFVKVASAPTDWSGEYILVYEQSATTGYVWTGVDGTNSYVSKTISNNSIVDDGFVTITIAPMTGGYSVKINGGTNNGKYIYGTSGSNKINFGTNPSLNTLSYESNSVKMVSNTSVMRYNNNSGQDRFRYFQSSTYTNQQPVQLYKRTYATQTHTIHFDSNGGNGTMNDQAVNEFEPTALQSNAFVREGFVFEGWNTIADGTGDYYADGATVTLLDDLTLYAQWNPLFNISLVQPNHGSISASASQAFAETEIILAAMVDPCYAFTQWMVTDAQGNAVTVTENQFEMPASDVTVSAVITYSPQSFVQEYQLVTSADQFVAGRTYLIVNVVNDKALGTTQNSNNRSASDVTIENDIISTIDNTVCELTLGGSTGAWTFFDAGWGNNGGYLYAASSSANHLKTQASNNANGQWSITIGEGGTATLAAQGSNSHNLLKYNNQSVIFSCYASGQQDVYLFRRTELEDYPAEQYVTLEAGWNWWTPTVETTLEALQTALGDTLMQIKSQGGTPTELVLGQMYRIQTSAPCQFTLSGLPATGVEVTITQGCNWFGFTDTEPLSLTALGISPATGDKVVSQDGGFAIYNGSTWVGTLTSLQPGKGYVYISVATQSKTLTF